MKAMMPEDVWDVITTDGSMTVVLHLGYDLHGDEGLLRQPKRKANWNIRQKQFTNSGQAPRQPAMDLASQSQQTRAISNTILGQH